MIKNLKEKAKRVFGPSLGWMPLRAIGRPIGTFDLGPMFYHLCKLIDARTTIEIGASQGYVSLCLGIHAKEVRGKHFAVEINKRRANYLRKWSRVLRLPVHVLNCNSVMLNLVGCRFDFAFIDGDHSYEGAKRDIEIIAPVLVEGGVLAMHDYGGSHDGVKRAGDELLGCRTWQKLTLPMGAGMPAFFRKESN